MSKWTSFAGNYIKSHRGSGKKASELMKDASRAFKGGGAMARRSNPGGLMKLVIPAAVAFGAWKLILEPAMAPKAPPMADAGKITTQDINKGY